jgi:hypothetical protein
MVDVPDGCVPGLNLALSPEGLQDLSCPSLALLRHQPSTLNSSTKAVVFVVLKHAQSPENCFASRSARVGQHATVGDQPKPTPTSNNVVEFAAPLRNVTNACFPSSFLLLALRAEQHFRRF